MGRGSASSGNQDPNILHEWALYDVATQTDFVFSVCSLEALGPSAKFDTEAMWVVVRPACKLEAPKLRSGTTSSWLVTQ